MSTSITSDEFTTFSAHLKQLLESDFPLADGFRQFAKEADDKNLAKAVSRISERLTAGMTLSDAIDKDNYDFPPHYISLLRAGEESGELLKVVDIALEHDQTISRLEKELGATVYYPLFTLCITILAFSAVTVFAFPVIERFYSIGGQAMPLAFRLLQSVFYGPTGIFCLGWISFLMIMLYLVKSRMGLAHIAMKLPFMKKIISDIYSAQLSKSLGLMLQAGVGLDKALDAVAASTSKSVLKKNLTRTANRVREGESLSSALNTAGFSGTGLLDMVSIGEDSGLLPQILEKGANIYREEAHDKIGIMLSIIEPVLLLIVGFWVFFMLGSWFYTYTQLFTLSI
jgi:type IV pilus assembly protein PilC